MGKGRDKRRKQKGSSSAGLGAVKTQRKTARNEAKSERRLDRRLERDEEDVDALLEKFKLEDARATQTLIEDNCPAPSVRVHATYTPLPPEVYRDGLVMVFGGEYEDQQERRVLTYNDLYKFNTEKLKWTKISAPNGPEPRSSHQTVYYKKALYVFGGEFTSPKQDRFKHFKELWRFDLETNTWEKYDVKRGPSARSGHRAAVYKNKMIVFGGFNDAGDEAIYYNDLWVFHFDEMRWESVGNPRQQQPSKRGGFRMVLYGDDLYVYGGYSKFRDEEDKDIEHGATVDDLWKLHLKDYKWERLKQAGILPGIRSGFNMCMHRHRAVYFGGATDNEAKKGECIVSDFHNDLFQFNFEKQRWYTVSLRAPRPSKKDQLPDAAAVSVLAEEEERMKRHKAATKIQSRYRGYAVRKAYKVYKLGGSVSELLYSPATYGFDMSVLNAPKPRGRISAGLCVVKNDLWLFGGIVEILEKEITLDDIWRLSLKNYDGWHCIQQNSVGEEAFREDDLSAATSSSHESEEEEDEMDTDASQ